MAKKFRPKFLAISIALVSAIGLYIVIGLNSVSLANQSDYNLEHIRIYSSWARSADDIFWEGSLSAHGKKFILIPGGDSGERLIVEIMWDGKLIPKEQEYPAFGPGKFRFHITKTGQINSEASNVFLR